MTTTLEQLRAKKSEIEAIAHTHGIRNIRVFGSVARGDDGPESDIDLLVKVDRDRDYFDVGGFLMDVQKMTGRKVDVLSENGVHHLIRDYVFEEATPL